MKTIDGYSKEKYTDDSVLLAGGGAKALSDFIGTLSWDSTNKKIQYTPVGGNATDLVILSWDNISGKPSTFSPSTHDHDDTYLKLIGGTLSGDLAFSHGSSANDQHITWASGTHYQRITIRDGYDEIFKFQYSTDTGSTWTDYFTITKNGVLVGANTVYHSGNLPAYPTSLPADGGTATNATYPYIGSASGDADYAIVFTTATAVGYGSLYCDSQFRSSLTFNPSTNKLIVNGPATVKGSLYVGQSVNTFSSYLRLLEYPDISSSFQGAYIAYDGASNVFRMGTNETGTSNANDIDFLTVDRGTKKVVFKDNAYVNTNVIYHAGNLPAYPTKSSWNYDDVYLKLSAGENDQLTGTLYAPRIAITNTGGSDEITFARGNYNYLRAKTSGGKIGFVADGKEMTGNSVDFAIGNGWVSVNNGTSGAGNYNLYVNGKAYASTSVTSGSFVVSGGTSSQFLKADGSVDSTSYSPSTHTHDLYIKKDSNTTISYTGGYWDLTGTSAGSIQSHGNYKNTKLSVIKGDKFLMKGGGMGGGILYAFTNSSGVIKQKPAADTVYSTYQEITAPEDGYLYVNFRDNWESDLIPISWVSGFLNRSTGDARYLKLTGGTVTGNITLNGAEILNSDGYHLVSWSSSQTSLGASNGSTRIRSNNSNLIHQKNGTDYIIYDSSNLTSLPASGGNSDAVYIGSASGNVDYCIPITTATAVGYGSLYCDSQWRSALTFNPSTNKLKVGGTEVSLDGHEHPGYATVYNTYGDNGALVNGISGMYMLGYNLGLIGMSNYNTSVVIATCTNGGSYSNVATLNHNDTDYLNGSIKSWFFESGHTNKKIKLTITAPQYIKSVAIYLANLESGYTSSVSILCNGTTSSISTWGSWHIISFTTGDLASTQVVEINTTYASNNVRIGGFRIAYTNAGNLMFPGKAWSAISADSASYAESAGSATSAGSASYADSAGSASSANKVANSLSWTNYSGTVQSFDGSSAVTIGGIYTAYNATNATYSTHVKTTKSTSSAWRYLTFVDSNNDSATSETVYTNKYLQYYPSSGELKCNYITLKNDGNVLGGLYINIDGGNNNPINASTSSTTYCINASNLNTHNNTFSAGSAVIWAIGSGYHYDFLATAYTSRFGGLELNVEAYPGASDSTDKSYSQKSSIYYVGSSKTVYLPTTFARDGRIIFVINDGNNTVTFQATGKTIKYFRRSGSGSATGSYSGEGFQCIYICIYYSNTWYIAPTDMTN